MENNIYKELARIQKELKVPKNQKNSFGNYNYRSCEDILEEVKPLLNNCVLTITDDIIMIGNRFYIKSIVKLALSKEEFIENIAFARECETKKGMDESQITGATSSYARKYALNGLFAIDDTKDSDFTNKHEKEDKKPQTTTTTATEPIKKQEVEEVLEKNIEGNIERCEEVISAKGTPYFKVQAQGEVFSVFGQKDLKEGLKIKTRLVKNGKFWNSRDFEVIENIIEDNNEDLDLEIPF